MIPIFSKIANTTNATVKIITISGLTFTPRVSSSKNRSRPALCIGIGAFFSRFFFRLPVLINDGLGLWVLLVISWMAAR